MDCTMKYIRLLAESSFFIVTSRTGVLETHKLTCLAGMTRWLPYVADSLRHIYLMDVGEGFFSRGGVKVVK